MANANRISRTARNARNAVEAAPVVDLAIVSAPVVVEAAPVVVEAAPVEAFRFPKSSDFEAAPVADNGALSALVATLTSEVATLKATVSEPKVERKSNSEGVKASWLVAETRKARLTRNSVTLSVNGAAPIGYDSFPKAFDANGKPGGAGKFTKARLELKEKGVLTLVNEEGISYRFELVTNA
jgi:hypothetical protein